MQDFSFIAPIATSLVLPLLGYLIIRRDKLVEKQAQDLRDLELRSVEQRGEIKALQSIAGLLQNNVTRAEFENSMRLVNDSLTEIKQSLKEHTPR